MCMFPGGLLFAECLAFFGVFRTVSLSVADKFERRDGRGATRSVQRDIDQERGIGDAG
ncbi:MAG: hypothetical protein H7Y11_00885, partial [Armatimonadetes bacterium]|nr:hypothetical protein [Anaerolineae bacterium]